jgi:hypothetical protein
MLAERRPVFHSEKDFQFELAWEIHTHHPDWDIRIERPVDIQDGEGARIHHDIWIQHNNEVMVIELKCNTAICTINQPNEIFNLQTHGAQNNGSYDFIRDIERLETTVGRCRNEGRYAVGYAVMITNDPRYSARARSNADYAAFSLHERFINGYLNWSRGVHRRREAPINLTGGYTLNWRDYSALPDDTPTTQVFRYLSVRVDGRQAYA